jgi:GT2 family glycosyltransferase
VIVVDNASADDSVNRLAAWATGEAVPHVVVDEDSPPDAAPPFLTMVCARRNYGFAGGSNIGLKRAAASHPAYYWLLNNDTVVPPDVLTTLTQAGEADPSVGLVSPLITYYSDPNIVWYGGGDLDFIRLWPRHWYLDQPVPAQRGAREVTFVTGCALLIRASCLSDVGLLNHELFFRHEDVEFCLRARRKSWKMVVSYDTRVLHKVGRSVGRAESPLIWYYDTRNRLYLGVHVIRFPRNLPFFVFFSVTRIGNLVRCFATGKMPHLQNSIAGTRDALLKRMGQAPDSVMERFRIHRKMDQ